MAACHAVSSHWCVSWSCMSRSVYVVSIVLFKLLALQGAENFKKELEQLRRAFRYDEFETVTAAAPPKNAFSKVGQASYSSAH